MSKKSILMLMLLCVFYVNSQAGMINFDDRYDVEQYLAQHGCAAKFFDLRTTETGRIVFWNTNEVTGIKGYEKFAFRLMKYDTIKGEQVELMNTLDLQKHLSMKQIGGTFEITTDRQLRYIVLNTGWSVDENYPAKGFVSDFIVLDLQTKSPVLKISDGRYHTEVSMSDDGRYLAYYSHPVNFVTAARSELIPMYRAEVFDLKTSTALTLSKECPKLLGMRDFIWSADSKKLLFFNHVQNGKDYDMTLFSWSPETGVLKQRPIREMRNNVNTLDLTPDNRVFLATPYEIHQLNTDLDRDRVIYKGKGIRKFQVDGKKIRFNENHGNGGLGEPRVLDLD